MTGLRLVTDLVLPPLWDGHVVEWTLQEPVEWRVFVCPPPKERTACPGCALRAEPVVWRGLVHPLDGQVEQLRTFYAIGKWKTVDVPAWPVIALICWRCPNCRVDEVWDMRSNEYWTLGPEDYGPQGSTAPTPADEGRLF